MSFDHIYSHYLICSSHLLTAPFLTSSSPIFTYLFLKMPLISSLWLNNVLLYTYAMYFLSIHPSASTWATVITWLVWMVQQQAWIHKYFGGWLRFHWALRRGPAGSYGGISFRFLRNIHVNFHVTVLILIPIGRVQEFIFLASFSSIWCVLLFPWRQPFWLGGGEGTPCFLRSLDRAGLVGVGGVLVLLQLSLVPPSVSLLIPGSLHPQNSQEGTLLSALLSWGDFEALLAVDPFLGGKLYI